MAIQNTVSLVHHTVDDLRDSWAQGRHQHGFLFPLGARRGYIRFIIRVIPVVDHGGRGFRLSSLLVRAGLGTQKQREKWETLHAVFVQT